MGVADDYFADDLALILEDDGETVEALVEDGDAVTAREVLAIVHRFVSEPIPGTNEPQMPRMEITVLNDTTDGIGAAEIRRTVHRVRVSERKGESLREEPYALGLLLAHDASSVKVRLR